MSTPLVQSTTPRPVAGLDAPPEAVAAPARLALIRRLELDGHLGDADLDGIVTSLAEGCRVPVAVVNIVTPDRQTYVAECGIGLPGTRVPDELSFCAEVVRTGRPLAVSDAGAHPVYARNPFVLDKVIASYAGQPLWVGGRVIGVLSIFDSKPRTFTGPELALLHTQARLVEAVLRVRAAGSCDSLTGLSTRAALLDRVAAELTRVDDTVNHVVLMVLELTGLGVINEQHGSDVGDRVLRLMADRLTAACETSDLCVRAGGSTLAVLWSRVSSPAEAQARAAAVATAVAGPVQVAELQLDAAVSLGLAVDSAGSADGLLAAAMRQASPLEPDTSGLAPGRSVVALRAAIQQQQLVLHYQPVVDLSTGQAAGVEGLVRWRHPDGRLIPPLDFVPLAEATGLIGELGDWVLRAAGAQAAAWAAAGHVLDVAVNLSPLQMARPGFAGHVLAILAEVEAPLDHVVLEVTESALLDDRTATDSLWALRGAGIRLALDDFGTGYASFSYLRRFPIDILKIDRSFTAGLGRHPDDDAIVGSIVSLARHTGKSVVAEGVETSTQRQALRHLGVNLAQGFLWTQPLPQDQMSAWLLSAGDVGQAAQAPDASEQKEAEARILRMHGEGASPHTIAAALNGSGERTSRNTRWHARSVVQVLSPTSSSRAHA